MVKAIIEAVYETDRAEIFAIFSKELSRDNQPFRRQLLQSLQKDFKLGLSVEGGEEEKISSLSNIRFIGELYKLQLLTARIIHECLKKLLAAGTPLALGKLLNLLQIAGPSLRE